MKNEKIKLRGRTWTVQSASDDRIVLVPAAVVDLAGWRKKKNLTQRAAADQLGISQTHLAKIELGQRTCPPELVQKLHTLWPTPSPRNPAKPRETAVPRGTRPNR